jgi:hypothetical protein
MAAKMRLLVVTDDPDTAGLEQVIAAMAEGRDVELKVVAPIRPASKLDLFTGEVDDSIAAAGERAESSAASGEGTAEVAQAEAEVGDADQLLAIEDALATFSAERIVLVDPDGDLAREAEEKFDLPVVAVSGGQHSRNGA